MTIPGEMLTHTNETSDHAVFFKMTAMLQQNAKALLQPDGLEIDSYVGGGAQRLLHLLLDPKNPGVALGSTSEENTIDTGFTDAVVDRPRVF